MKKTHIKWLSIALVSLFTISCGDPTIKKLNRDTTYLSYVKYDAEDTFITDSYSGEVGKDFSIISTHRPIKSIIRQYKGYYCKIAFDYSSDKITTIQYSTYNGEILNTKEDYYNDNGNLIKSVTYGKHGNILRGIAIEVEPLQHTTKDIVTDKITKIVKFNNRGEKIEDISIHYFGDNNTEYHQHCDYYDHKTGDLIKTTVTDPDYEGAFDREYKYEYNANGQKVKQIALLAGTGNSELTFFYEYDDSGNEIAIRRKDSDSDQEGYDLEILYEYKGNKQIKYTQFIDGDLDCVVVYEYNEYGDLIREEIQSYRHSQYHNITHEIEYF